MSTETGRFHPGCLGLILAAVLGGGLLAAALLFFDRTDGDESAGSPTTSASPSPASDCVDATAQFQQTAPADDALARVRRVCWQESGQLRAEIDYPADIEAASPPMRWLCTALTSFIAGSDRPWNGFTAYSTATVSPGQVVLSRTEQDQACVNPARQ